MVAGRTGPSDLAEPEQRTSPGVAYTPGLAASGVIPVNSLGGPYDVVVAVAAAAAAVAAVVAVAAADERMMSAVERHSVPVAIGRPQLRRVELPLPHCSLLDLLTVSRGLQPPRGVQCQSRSRTYPTSRVQKLCLIVAVSAAYFLLHVSMRASSTR